MNHETKELPLKLQRRLTHREILMQEVAEIKKANILHNKKAEIARKQLQK